MVTVKHIVDAIEAFAPLSLQAAYDNCGLVCGKMASPVTSILLSLDVNEEVVLEAAEKHCKMILVHHPPVFSPLRSFDESEPTVRALTLAIKEDIAIYAAHTNADFTDGGINDTLAETLGLCGVGTVRGNPFDPRIGSLISPMTLASYAEYVSEILDDPSVSFIGNPDKRIETAAVVNGAGGGDTEIIKTAFLNGADVFLTAEVKYHVARFTKDNNYAIILFGHYESEKCFSDIFERVLSKIPYLEVLKTQCLSNPYHR